MITVTGVKLDMLRIFFHIHMTKSLLKLLFITLIGTFFTSCSLLDGTSKYELSEGVYGFKRGNVKARKVFLQVEEDSLLIYPIQQRRPAYADTTRPLVLEMTERGIDGRRDYLLFRQPSFDVDIITILFKYRPKEEEVARQLNTDFNAALFIGYRADSYTVTYDPTPINTFLRNTRHFGYSVGLFSGLGSTMIAPWFTRDVVQMEYDGLVFVNGLAANIAYNDITFGLGVGIDHLMDHNRRHWVYQGEPWIGFTLGLNLN